MRMLLAVCFVLVSSCVYGQYQPPQGPTQQQIATRSNALSIQSTINLMLGHASAKKDEALTMKSTASAERVLAIQNNGNPTDIGFGDEEMTQGDNKVNDANGNILASAGTKNNADIMVSIGNDYWAQNNFSQACVYYDVAISYYFLIDDEYLEAISLYEAAKEDYYAAKVFYMISY